MTREHRKKLVAPIVVSSLLILYYLCFTVICLLADTMPLAPKLIFGLLPLALVAVCIYVLVERIREIRSGEEDDLGKY